MNQQIETRKAVASDEGMATLLPLVNVVEDAGGITLMADMPGVPKDALDIHIDGDTLALEGQVALDVPDGMAVHHTEVALPRYRRVFTLSKELDPEKVTAELVNGVLKLRIPKAEHAQPHKIAVQIA
ncbi:Hsp20/alpha crystallin family protein [Candidatus Macondimonas diazotrophica]|jgi:HSP20 family molecular chaperone IbpA|uniref:Hsp20/alpha crystallin family protein n=1 Tax=Candidatus Macondimonas diazotrophica TaxID=2305248 RepID=A0A4Z0F8A4_9GAMM|nr:Hsp20/alpha crystallin family protein [Candidatus Macondimonas diazotrophica]NCU00143.1 Hsp20/alpha crystallin family protein [Candidatus Macondimonas diazotrophica]TFZ81800.1 Hsp20/alpha crystallin family protein [Candidatus Macondimonas diazotrophica]HBG29335.1 heat-shock protein [Gammaproteobacteria bacterium]HBG51358.1 heat-shock protein [Gammaproteobacteria bacterium]